MILKIVVVLVVLVALLLVIAAFQPREYRVSRSIVIAAPAAVPFGYLDNLHRWQEMSPYVKMDPSARYTFDGPTTGRDASMTWAGNAKVGEGRMTIVETRPNELVRMRIDFKKPFEGTGVADFTFEPVGDKTRVTWTMVGEKVFITKLIGVFVSMDKMIGGQFEEGLATLKTLSENTAHK